MEILWLLCFENYYFLTLFQTGIHPALQTHNQKSEQRNCRGKPLICTTSRRCLGASLNLLLPTLIFHCFNTNLWKKTTIVRKLLRTFGQMMKWRGHLEHTTQLNLPHNYLQHPMNLPPIYSVLCPPIQWACFWLGNPNNTVPCWAILSSNSELTLHIPTVIPNVSAKVAETIISL